MKLLIGILFQFRSFPVKLIVLPVSFYYVCNINYKTHNYEKETEESIVWRDR